MELLLGSTARAQVALGDSTHRRNCGEARPRSPKRASVGKTIVADTIPHCLSSVELFADGNVKDVVGNSGATSIASGSLGMRFVGSRYEVAGSVNVFGTTDTVTQSYGATLLAPSTGRGLNAAQLVVRSRFRDWGDRGCADYSYSLLCNMGWRAEANATSRNWATAFRKSAPPPGGTDSVKTVSSVAIVPMYGIDLGLWYQFFDGRITGSDSSSRPAAMILDLGYSRRALRGDLGAADGHLSTVRAELLQTPNKTFTGIHLGLTLRYNQVESSFTYFRLDGSAIGISGGQVVASVSLNAALVSGVFRRQ
jgi:hypothetical protein